MSSLMKNKKWIYNIILALGYFSILFLFIDGFSKGKNSLFDALGYLSISNLLLFFYLLVNFERIRKKINAEETIPLIKISKFKAVFYTIDYIILTLLIGAVFIGVLFSISLEALTVIFALCWLQVILTFYVCLLVNSYRVVQFMAYMVLGLFALELLLDKIFSIKVITLNPFALIVSSPLWVSNFRALPSISGAMLITFIVMVLLKLWANKYRISNNKD